jgi:hypothetical protein
LWFGRESTKIHWSKRGWLAGKQKFAGKKREKGNFVELALMRYLISAAADLPSSTRAHLVTLFKSAYIFYDLKPEVVVFCYLCLSVLG